MKSLVRHLLSSRIVQGGLVLVLATVVLASLAWSSPPEPRVKLGGTWVGRLGDITWIGTYAPDAAGQNAAITLQWMTLSTDFEALMASIGAQSMSMVSGSMSMTSSNTASGKLIWYVLAPGTASTIDPVAGQVKAIAVMTSEWHFTSPTAAEGSHTLKMYFPNALGSLLPEDGQLFFDVTFENVHHQKIN